MFTKQIYLDKIEEILRGQFVDRAYENGETTWGVLRNRDKLFSLFCKMHKELISETKIEDIHVNDYLPLVVKWDGKTYDGPFDDGFNEAIDIMRAKIEELEK